MSCQPSYRLRLAKRQLRKLATEAPAGLSSDERQQIAIDAAQCTEFLEKIVAHCGPHPVRTKPTT